MFPSCNYGGRWKANSVHRLFLVVTGATAGIGRDFALQLAAAGFNVFLASRTASKLEEISQEIRQFLPYPLSRKS